jgi:transposase
MSHRNARLSVHGRLLLIDRVVRQGWGVARAAKAMGVSWQCAHRWMSRFAAEGESGLVDRLSRPHRSPTRTPAEVERRAVALRLVERRGQDWLGPELGLPARTVSRILRRHGDRAQPLPSTLQGARVRGRVEVTAPSVRA